MVTVVFSGNHNRDAQDFKLEDVAVGKEMVPSEKKLLHQLEAEPC